MHVHVQFTKTVLVVGGVSLVCWTPFKAQAQIRADRTLPQPTVVRADGNRQLIEAGTQSGKNLFHSFEAFSVSEGQTASFQNGPHIQRILSRVTGRSASNIRGAIEAQGTANLYLLNPNGIVFGPNAELRIGGSFLATTAESFEFQKGQTFSAVSPSPTPLLSVTAPIGVQFGANPRQIQVSGSGHQLFVDFPFIEETRPAQGLEVFPRKTLALIGGAITLDGGNLRATDGHLELGAVGSADRVALSPQLRGNYDTISQPGDITLKNAAALNSSGNGSGSVALHGGRIRLLDGSTVLARTLGSGKGTGINITASKLLELKGFSEDALGPAFPTSLLTDVAVFAGGQGSPVSVKAGTLRILDGAFISAGTFDRGHAGAINIIADRIELLGDGPFSASGLFSDTFAPGRGGQVNIKTGTLLIADGAQISTSTLSGSPLGAGEGGSQKIIAQEMDLSGGAIDTGASGLFANVQTNRPGGTIDVTASRLSIVDGAQIATSSFGAGAAGDIRLSLDQAQLVGTSPNGAGSGIFSNAEASGSGGTIRLQGRSQSRLQTLEVAGGAQIASSTFDTGRAGSIAIAAQELHLIGEQTPSNRTTGIIAAVETQASGQGGTVTLTGDRLLAQDGAQVSVGTRGSGNAGDLNVTVQSINLQGGDRFGRSGLFVSALDSTGASGNLNIRTRDLTLDQGATLNASNFPSRAGSSLPGTGAAGNVNVQAQTIDLNRQSEISAATAAGDRGNITLSSNRLQLGQGSQILTNAQGSATGGNINLNHNFIFASGNSDITANAQQNFGGRIVIQTQGIFGAEFREQLTFASDITASSDLGPAFMGIVQINSPETDPSDNLVNLPSVIISRNQEIQNVCRQTAGNSFSVSQGQSSPDDFSASSLAVDAWFERGAQSQSRQLTQSHKSLREAQGWAFTQARLKLVSTPLESDSQRTLSC